MKLTTTEKIKLLLSRKDLTITEFAPMINTTRQNFTNKLARNNFTEQDLIEIASALDCTYESFFILNDTGEKL